MNRKKINRLLEELGISPRMVQSCRTPVFEEAENLVDAGEDMFGRPQQMTAATCIAWQAMQNSAAQSNVELKLVSAFRSVEYQCEVIRQKLGEGRSLDDILSVNAIPGHSEHHTGCALDLHTGEGEPLTEAFEQTPAFNWLMTHAFEFGFRLSFPRNNPHGIDYEPWHWCWHSEEEPSAE